MSRQLDITDSPVVISVGAIKGGIRYNIIPDRVEMVGTIRTFSEDVRSDVIQRIERTVTNIADASGATATLTIADAHNLPVINDPALTARSLPTLKRVVGEGNVRTIPLQTTGEDFSFYGQNIPSLFFWVGVTPHDRDPATVPFNHSPQFYLDEASLAVGMKALLSVATDYLQTDRPPRP